MEEIIKNETEEKKSVSFIEQKVINDLAEGKNGGRMQTRFPPEPNGYLHIGHAKAIAIDFGLAKKYGGQCNLRFDDTNPIKEDTEYIESIENDIKWLGFKWANSRNSGTLQYGSSSRDAPMLMSRAQRTSHSRRVQPQALAPTVLSAIVLLRRTSSSSSS